MRPCTKYVLSSFGHFFKSSKEEEEEEEEAPSPAAGNLGSFDDDDLVGIALPAEEDDYDE